MAATSSSSGGGSGGGSSSSGRDAISLRGPTEPGSKAQRLEWPGFESRSLSRSLRLWRQYIWITLDDPTASRTAQCVSFFLITAIVMSIANFSVGSYPTDFCGWRDAYTASAVRICASDRLETHPKSKSIEMFCVIVFTLEYLIRLLTVTSQSSIERFVRPDGSEYREAVRPAVLLRRFLVDPMNLLDLAAVLPWYILLVIDLVLKPDGEGGLQKIFGVVRLVRLTRILRIFKVSKSMKMMIVLFRTLVRSRSTLLLLLAASLVLMLAFGAFAVVFERGLYNPALRQYVRVDGSASPFLSIPEAMYWCMTTMTTVGYGDLYPITPMGWLFGVLCALTGIIILSLPITVIGATFQEEVGMPRHTRLAGHAGHAVPRLTPAPRLPHRRRVPTAHHGFIAAHPCSCSAHTRSRAHGAHAPLLGTLAPSLPPPIADAPPPRLCGAHGAVAVRGAATHRRARAAAERAHAAYNGGAEQGGGRGCQCDVHCRRGRVGA